MGWLPVRWKHKGDEHPESQAVQSAGEHGKPGGTGIMGDPSKSVVSQGGSNTVHVAGRNSVNQSGGNYASPFPASPRGVNVIGGPFPALDPKGCQTCGHSPSVALVAGCWDYQHVHVWLACHRCQMDALFQVRHGENQTVLQCGHTCGDLIYAYLPNDPEYDSLGGKIFTSGGSLVL